MNVDLVAPFTALPSSCHWKDFFAPGTHDETEAAKVLLALNTPEIVGFTECMVPADTVLASEYLQALEYHIFVPVTRTLTTLPKSATVSM